MANYNYRVIVNLEINPQGARTGANAEEAHLRRIERQVFDSQKRITDYETNFARQRYDAKVADYNRQVAASQKFSQDLIQLEVRTNQSIAAERRRANIARFNDQRAAAQREVAIERQKLDQILALNISANRARQASINTSARSGAAGAGQVAGAFTPTPFLTAQQQRAQSIDDLLNIGRLGARTSATPDFGTTARGGVSPDAVNQLRQVDASLRQVTDSTRRSSAEFGVWGRAFRGAFVGAVAGLTFSVLIGGIFGIARATVDAGIAAIQAGADFEVTTRALEVFAGSTTRANRELADIAETARNTAGLRLETAEKGYQRLRALGFQAELARGFIKELGEEKILSGASDESLERIIFNFAQIASGGQKVSQELREILTQMPSLRNAFVDAFGTLNPQRIQAFFDKDVDGAFRRLQDAMSRQEAATGGLTDSWGKLLDEVTQLQRAFSEPFIEPLTDDIREITYILQENHDEIRNIGSATASVISEAIDGVVALYRDIKAIADILDRLAERNPNRDEATRFVNPLAYQPREDIDTPENRANKLAKSLTRQSRLIAEAYREQEVEQKVAEDKALLAEDKFRQRQIETIRSAMATQNAEIQASYDVRIAQAQSRLDLTVEAEIETLKKVAELRRQRINDEIQAENARFGVIYQLNEGNLDEQTKLTTEHQQKIIALNKELQLNQIELNADLARKEYEQGRRRRENQIENIRLQKQETQSSYSERIAFVERMIERENGVLKNNYDELFDLTRRQADRLTQLTRREYELRLQDASLSAEERLNVEKERDLELQRIARETSDRILEIQDRQYQQEQQLLERNVRRKNEVLQNYINSYQELFGSLRSGGFASLDLDLIEKALFGGDTFSQIITSARKAFSNVYNDALREQGKVMDELNNALNVESPNEFTATLIQSLNAQLTELDEKVNNASVGLKNFKSAIRDDVVQIGELIDVIRQGNAEIDTFDNLRMATLRRIHSFQVESIDNEIKAKEEAMKTAEAQKRTGDVEQYRFERDALLQRRNLLLFQQNKEVAEAYRQTIKGINEEIENLLSGDKRTLQDLDDIFNHQQRTALRDILNEVYFLEKELASPDITAQYRVRAGVLQHIIDLRNQEADAITRTLNAQIDFDRQFTYSAVRADADLAEFLASQKGITEILSDARIGAITTAYDGLDRVARSLAKNFGFAADAVEDLISSLLKLGLNWFMRRFLGIGGNNQQGGLFGGGGQGGGIGGFQIPQLGGTGGFGLGGFGGFPTVPFNPNAGTGIGGFGGFGGLNFTGTGGGDFLAGTPRGVMGNIIADRNAFLSRANPPAGSGVFGGTGLSAFGGFAQLGTIGLTGALLGSGLGRGSIGGGILGGIGGLLGAGSAAAFLMPSLFGVGTAAGSSPFMAAAFGLLTNPFTIAAAGALLVGAYLIGRSSARRRDEKIRNQAMVDALKGIDDLIQKVNSDQMDGAQALAQAQAIRDKYVQDMSQLKTKKTRDIALKDVSRIDAKIAELNTAIGNQTARRERLEQSVPTFADGGAVSGWAMRNYKNNPLGYQMGGQSVGYFPEAKRFASFNERGSEYIFDAETTRNVGVQNFELMRQTKGQSFKDMQRAVKFGGFQDGGGLAMPVMANAGTQGAASAQGAGGMQVINQIHVTLGMETVIEALVELIRQSNGSCQQINDITNFLKTDGGNEFVQEVIKVAKSRNLIK